MSSVPSGSVERDASKAISRSGPTSAMGELESGSSDVYSGVPGVPSVISERSKTATGARFFSVGGPKIDNVSGRRPAAGPLSL